MRVIGNQPDACKRLDRVQRERGYTLDELDWSRGVDRNRPWVPAEIAMPSCLSTYRVLDPEEQRRCRQLEALGLCEQFIWLEQSLAMPAIVNTLKRRDLSHVLRAAMWQFLADEDKHVEMFWRLLERSEPSWYPPRRPRLFRLSVAERLLVSAMVAAPRLCLAWLPITVFVEERTVCISRAYIECRQRAPEQVDALHAQAHALHLRDEARHCVLGHDLLRTLYDPAPRWARAACGLVFRRFLSTYAMSPGTARSVARQLGKEFPRLRDAAVGQMLSEIQSAPGNAGLRARLLALARLPLTRKILETYPEHRASWVLHEKETLP